MDKENLGPGVLSPQISPSLQSLNAKKTSSLASGYGSPNDSPQSHIAVMKMNFSPKNSPKNQPSLAATPKLNRLHHVHLYKDSLNSPFKEHSNSPRMEKVGSPIAFSPKRNTPKVLSNRGSPSAASSTGSPSRFALNPHSPSNRITHFSPSLSPLAWQSKLQSPKFVHENDHPLAGKNEDQSESSAVSSGEVSAKQKMWESIVDDWAEWNTTANKSKLRTLIILQVCHSFILFISVTFRE
jgi:hypothetical protein